MFAAAASMPKINQKKASLELVFNTSMIAKNALISGGMHR
ncbi:hypothetical protein G134_811 [Lactobacillus delbrueckii subsp. lactis CRL581]|nr:hypothetical protein G134_811 [Lactobacillus delbrueckii subsp. lactis CRL581]